VGAAGSAKQVGHSRSRSLSSSPGGMTSAEGAAAEGMAF